MFPERFHAFFFIGTYSVSLLIAPVNAAIGDLCSAPAHGDVHSPHCAQPHHSLTAQAEPSGPNYPAEDLSLEF